MTKPVLECKRFDGFSHVSLPGNKEAIKSNGKSIMEEIKACGWF